MKRNIRHAITVKECSQVVENAYKNNAGRWHSAFRASLNIYNYSIFRLIDSVRNNIHPTPQGREYWDIFRARDYV